MTSTLIGSYEVAAFKQLGDAYKAREADLRELTVIPRDENFSIRVDGRAFHTFTKGCIRPFDGNLIAAMDSAASAVLQNMHGWFAYVQSDEITFAFKSGLSETNPNYEHPFGGRVDKLLTIVASLTSVAFFAAAQNLMDLGTKMLPHFDARLAEVGGQESVVANAMWRESDARRNAISSISQSSFSQKELQGVNIAQQVVKLGGIKLIRNNIELQSKYAGTQFDVDRALAGVYLRTTKVQRTLTEIELEQIPEHVRPDSDCLITRTEMVRIYPTDATDLAGHLTLLLD